MAGLSRAATSGFVAVAVLASIVGCAGDTDASGSEQPQTTMTEGAPAIQALNAFYYYDDVDAAWAFYRDVLGLATVVDYGFAKIMRVAGSSYVTLVDAESGMHSTEEPKSVTLAFVTEEVEGWYDYLVDAGVEMRSEYRFREGQPHDGFVAVDPEGYLLEFERFNPHPENERLMPVLASAEAVRSATPGSARPDELGVHATVFWLYYDALEPIQRFYEEAMGLEMIVDQGWAKVYPISSTGFIGFVDGAQGLHSATEDKAVTLSFITDDVEGWFEHVRAHPGFRLRTPEITDESGRVHVFVGYDPDGYFLEWDTFLDVEGNEELLTLLDAEERR